MTRLLQLVLRARRTLVLLVLATMAAGGAARAELRLDVTRGTFEPMPIAVTNLHGRTEAEKQLGLDIAQVVRADLERSGLFRPLDPRAFIQTPEALQAGPRYPDWKIINAQALVTGTAELLPDGTLEVKVYLWDIFAEQYVYGERKLTPDPSRGWRKIAHQVSDLVYERITGEMGFFDTQIVYISETGRPDQRIKRLAIMDSDGENHQFLTDGQYMVLTPRFSPTERVITYFSYFNGRPRAYLFNLETRRQELLGDFPGMTFAPRFSPDGNKVVLTLAVNGNSDLYEMDLRTRRQRRLTDSPSIDTGGSFSPDGRQIVFESDRGGSQQLYVMNADGTDARRITFGQGRYGNAVWSPRGDLIAFIKQHQGQFSLGVIRPDGTGERLITSAYHLEGPTWAPNGRYLIYFKEAVTGADRKGRSAKIYSIDLTGRNERMVPTPLDGSDPAWSPLPQK